MITAWQLCTRAEGEFSIAYPLDYTLYQNQVPCGPHGSTLI
jgi:hypothetical protein